MSAALPGPERHRGEGPDPAEQARPHELGSLHESIRRLHRSEPGATVPERIAMGFLFVVIALGIVVVVANFVVGGTS